MPAKVDEHEDAIKVTSARLDLIDALKDILPIMAPDVVFKFEKFIDAKVNLSMSKRNRE